VVARWKDLARLPEDRLASVDVAEVNLACADGLRDAPTATDAANCLARLDECARHVRRYTEARLHVFTRHPGRYDNSEAKFRIVCMITDLYRELGIRYNPGKIDPEVPLDTADTFIHGALLGEGGTCCSLPVVYAAVGRRLGYPIKLATTWRHLFARWDQPGGELFNIEANDHSIDTPPDDHYREGIFEHTPAEEVSGGHLVSQTPRMELAEFISQRGFCLAREERLSESAEAFLFASGLAPGTLRHSGMARRAMERWDQQMIGEIPPGFPRFEVVSFPARRFPEGLPAGVERMFIRFSVVERCLRAPRHQGWLAALRRGERPADLPSKIEFSVTE
jgi:hypothetical protein